MSSITNAYSITMGWARMGGAAVLPPGGVQSAAPSLVVRSVLDCRVYLDAKSQSSYLEVLAPDASDPFFLSPGAWGTPESRANNR